MDRKAQFLNIYYNLPIKLRNEAILVLSNEREKQIITWNVAFQEVSNDTPLSEIVLKKLEELSII